MRLIRPHQVLAGFRADQPDPNLGELRTVGEEWAAPSREIGWHHHLVWEVYLQVDGRSRWEAQGQVQVLEPGMAYLCPPGLRHRLRDATGPRHHYMYVIFDLAAAVRARLGDVQPDLDRLSAAHRLHVGTAPDLAEPLRLLATAAQRGAAHRELALRLALDALCLACINWGLGQQGPALRAEHPLVEEARRLMQADPSKPWPLAALAQAVGLSPRHLCTVFRRETGQAPHQYLLACRIAKAKQALASTALSITSIAGDCGFATSQHFARAFRRATGRSASHWRATEGRAWNGGHAP